MNSRLFSLKLLFLLTLFSSHDMKCQQLLSIPDTLSGTAFSLQLSDSNHVFYPGFTTGTYAFNGSYLGPTLILKKGDSINIQVNNALPDTTTVHWHGLHVAAMNDGGPHTPILPGAQWIPGFKVRDQAATYWYHPHLHMKTAMQVNMGAAGLIIVRDSVESSLDLPRTYGVDDIPLIIQSKCFDNNKQLVSGNASDSVIVVNGTRNPYWMTPAQVIRFRLLNASAERVLEIGFQGNLVFHQITSDGGLLDSPVALSRLRLAPGERAEILLNFSSYIGQTIQLMSFASELPNAVYGAAQPGMGPGQTIPGYAANPLNGNDFVIMNFQVVSPTANPVTAIPSQLTINNPISPALSVNSRTLTFSPMAMGQGALTGGFLINNSSFDMGVINYSIPLNAVEIWTLNNQSPIAHPFHIHDVQFYVLEVNGAIPPLHLQGRKDVILVPAMQSVKFIAKFDTFCDSMMPYMYHCHMLPHEDDGMMGQFVVTCPSATGTTELSMKNIKVYPNPFQSELHFISGNQQVKRMKISDVNGKVVFETNDAINFMNLNSYFIEPGIYYFDAETDIEKFHLPLIKTDN